MGENWEYPSDTETERCGRVNGQMLPPQQGFWKWVKCFRHRYLEMCKNPDWLKYINKSRNLSYHETIESPHDAEQQDSKLKGSLWSFQPPVALFSLVFMFLWVGPDIHSPAGGFKLFHWSTGGRNAFNMFVRPQRNTQSQAPMWLKA